MHLPTAIKTLGETQVKIRLETGISGILTVEITPEGGALPQNANEKPHDPQVPLQFRGVTLAQICSMLQCKMKARVEPCSARVSFKMLVVASRVI